MTEHIYNFIIVSIYMLFDQQQNKELLTENNRVECIFYYFQGINKIIIIVSFISKEYKFHVVWPSRFSDDTHDLI